MNIFVDTSAFYAILDADDEFHSVAKSIWIEMVTHDVPMVTSNYVLVESFALIQSRLGIEALRAFSDDVVPQVTIEWVDKLLHQEAIAGLLTAVGSKISLVDCCSFSVMRRHGIKKAFSFDKHFVEQGFTCVS